MFDFTRILVPTDFSRQSWLSLLGAIRLARRARKARILLLHVLPPARAINYPGDLGKEMPALIRKQEDQANYRLEQWRRRIPAGIPSEILLERGPVGASVVRACREHAIDLVVMTTHARRGLRRLLNPNLSERIVRGAPCPVMVFHLAEARQDSYFAPTPPRLERLRNGRSPRPVAAPVS